MPAPCERQSTGPRDRMARRTSEQRRWRRPTPYRQGLPDTPSPRGSTSPDRDPCANPDLRSTLLVGISRDQARVYRKTFATNQTGRNAGLDDTFEYATKDIPLAKALIAGPRE